MKVAILVGGRGTRLTAGEDAPPKALFEIGGRPIVWHIMNLYAAAGLGEFVLLLGYKGQDIVDYFVRRLPFDGRDVRLRVGAVVTSEFLGSGPDAEWTVTFCHTGLTSEKGERIRRARQYLEDEEDFMVTYGDGVSDVDLQALLRFHRSHGLLATVTAVRPPARFGGLVFDGELVAEFTEKPQIGEGWINGGFLVFEPQILDYLDGDRASLEGDLLEQLAAERQLAAYRHEGFWQCMDTLRDKRLLESLWESGKPLWKVWA